DSPNPFSPNNDGVKDTTVISYTLSDDATVTVKIYDASNTLVRTLVNAASRSAGANSETWDGKNDSNTVVADGTYTFKIDASDASANDSPQSGTATLSPPAALTTSASPNPFSPNNDGVKDTTAISYTLSQDAAVTVKIYDAGNTLV